MEIEVETGEFSLDKEKKIAKLFSQKREIPKKEIKKPVQKVVVKSAKVTPERKSRTTITIVSIMALGCLFLGYFTYNYYGSQIGNVLEKRIPSEKEKDQMVLDSIAKIMELPGNESPIIAAADDVEKIDNRVFFSNAQENDQVVIYRKENKVIVYRPSSGKIIDIVPFMEKNGESVAGIQSEIKKEALVDQVVVANVLAENGKEDILTKNDAQVQKEEKKIRVAIYNGTKSKGVSAKLAEEISSANSSVDVVIKANAKGDYVKTTIIDLIGNNADFVASMASVIGGDVSKGFPQGEAMPEADVLIISGENSLKRNNGL